MPIRRDSEDIVQDFIRTHYLTKKYKEISKILGISQTKVCKLVKEMNLAPKHKVKRWTENEKYLLKEHYPRWKSLEPLLATHSAQAIAYKAMELGLTKKTQRVPKTSIWINWDFFSDKNFGTDKFSYFLGLMHADGYISSARGYKIGFTFASKDLELYSQLNKEIGGRLYRRKQGDYSFLFYSKRLYRILTGIGIIERKTKKLRISDINIPLKISAYLRGVFDGDGCIYYNPAKSRKQLTITAGCREFLADIKEVLDSKNITAKIHQLKEREVWNLHISQTDISKFFNLIYQDATFKMKRRYDKMCLVK